MKNRVRALRETLGVPLVELANYSAQSGVVMLAVSILTPRGPPNLIG